MNESYFKDSPLELLEDQIFISKGLTVYVKRDDLIHPFISGNKWRKLKYNIQSALDNNTGTLVTFGGAFSNHIYATASACQHFGLKSIGIIRGEAMSAKNPTLQFASDCDMELHFVSREHYRDKDEVLKDLELDGPEYYILPEGGTNTLALKGCKELISEVTAQLNGQLPDHWLLSCGTGGTMAGLLSGLNEQSGVHGIAVLKGGFMASGISKLLEVAGQQTSAAWQVHEQYHFGGYARYNQELIDFINTFREKHQIRLDPVYTGKLFFAFYELVNRNFFLPNSTIVLLHSGGLQGICGFNQRFGNLIKV